MRIAHMKFNFSLINLIENQSTAIFDREFKLDFTMKYGCFSCSVSNFHVESVFTLTSIDLKSKENTSEMKYI